MSEANGLNPADLTEDQRTELARHIIKEQMKAQSPGPDGAE